MENVGNDADTMVPGSQPDPQISAIREAVPVGSRLGPYRVDAEIGRGAMGVVFRAHRDDLQRDFALKVMGAGPSVADEMVERFRREAQTAAGLADHPGIVGVHDVGQAKGVFYIALTLVEGPSLDQVILEGELTPKNAAAIVAAVARAVAFAHGRGILHRDIKPANILLDRDGAPQLTDFGLARARTPGDQTARLTQEGAMLGTPAYMAPEQVRGETLDGRADVYALGVTLYEAMTGVPVFGGSSVHHILGQVLNSDPLPPSRRTGAIPRDLETIVLKAIAKEADGRYATAAELADDLERWLKGEPIHARRAGVLERIAKRIRRNPTPWAVGAVMGLALIVTLVVTGMRASRAQARRAAELAGDLRTARALLATDPDQALGVLARLAAADPAYPGLAEAQRDAEARRAGMARDRRRDEAGVLLAAGARAATEHAALTGAAFNDGEPEAIRERNAALATASAMFRAVREMLAEDPDAPAWADAGRQLADLAAMRLGEAEWQGDRQEAARHEAVLREFGGASHAATLQGTGTLTLVTDPPGATVAAYRYLERGPALEPTPLGSLGVTPLQRIPLEMGSYLLVLTHPDFADVRYPVLIERGEADEPPPIRLLTRAQVGAGWAYVPAGESILGGDPGAVQSWPRRRVRVGAFLVRVTELTAGEWTEFLVDLAASDPDDARRMLPDDSWRVRSDGTIEAGDPPDHPAHWMTWPQAQAFLRWRSDRDGVAYRLPTEEEWERAARGADGRAFVYGNDVDWQRFLGGLTKRAGSSRQSQPVGSIATDVSPFGVRDLTGSVKELCAGEFEGGLHPVRGGDYFRVRHGMFRAAARNGYTDRSHGRTGFRLARDLP